MTDDDIADLHALIAERRQAYLQGRREGYEAGYAAAETDMACEWSALARDIHHLANRPTWDELVARRRALYIPPPRPAVRICGCCTSAAEHTARLAAVWPAMGPVPDEDRSEAS